MEIEQFIDEVREQVASEKYNFDKCATRLDRDGPYHKEDVVAAILAAEGSFVDAARLLGRQRTRLRDYVYRNPDVLEFFDDFLEGQIDLIERNFMKAAVEGDLGASWKILSTRGHQRGYGRPAQSVDLTSTDGSMTPKPTEITIQAADDKSDD